MSDHDELSKCQPFLHIVDSMNYDTKGPCFLAAATCLFWSVMTFVVSSLNKNYSQTDKLWSIVPFLYTWMFVCDTRTSLMAFLATIWGIRLTYNFNRRGGYSWPPWSGEEDYRWELIQKGEYLKILTNPLVWCIFNLTFISFYQHILLMLMVAPAFFAWSMANSPGCVTTSIYSPDLNTIDAIATILFVIFLVIETIADNQQYAFQIEKYKRINAAGGNRKSLEGEYAEGFLQSGLFSIVRKPNYAAEQSIWVSFYIFSIASTGGKILINWSVVGCILLMALFFSSGPFTESITVKKYPKYADYQKSVPLYWPFLSIFKTKTKPKTN